MSELRTYRCDLPGCKAQKGEANHWFLGFVGVDEVTVMRWPTAEESQTELWKARVLNAKAHLCGIAHASAWMQQQLEGGR